MNIQQSIKSAYNITFWPELQLNYWGVPKAANTSVKFSLLKKTGYDVSRLTDKTLHQPQYCVYITKDTALQNHCENFTVVRHPYDRATSLFRDFGLKRRPKWLSHFAQDKLSDLNYFFSLVLPTMTDSDNIHFRSQTALLCDKKRKILVDRVWSTDLLAEVFAFYRLDSTLRNSSSDKHKIDLSTKHKKIVVDRYRYDFEIFGFKA